MTYLDKGKDEKNGIEFTLHFNLQDALLIRSLFINQHIEYIEMLDKPPFSIDLTTLKQIQQLIQIDKSEIEFRIKKLQEYIKLFDNGLSKTSGIQKQAKRSVLDFSPNEEGLRRLCT